MNQRRANSKMDEGAQRQRKPRAPRATSGAAGILTAITLAVVVGLITASVHWPSLSSKALGLDDYEYLVKNPLVRSPGVASASRFFTEILEPSTVHGYYQPLSMISLMLDCAIGGGPDKLTPFRVTSLTLHCLNAMLVTILLWRIFGSAWAAALVGLLFGVHPLTIESIPWLSERKTLLSMFFCLLSLLLYVARARQSFEQENPEQPPKRFRAILLIGSVLFFMLALLSKPTVVPLPVLLLLIDYWPLNRLSLRVILEKIPYFVVAVISGIITTISQGRTVDTIRLTDGGLAAPVFVLCHNCVFYLLKIVWPGDLCWFYSFPEPLDMGSGMVLAGVIGTPIIAAALLLSWRWTRAFFVGGLFFYVALLPVMNVLGFTITIAADRFVYFPAIGLLLILCWGITRVFQSHRAARYRTSAALVAVLMVAATLEIVSTRRHLPYWESSERLFRNMLAHNPTSPTVRVHLAGNMAEAGRFDEAATHLQEAIRFRPDYPTAHYQLGRALVKLGRVDEAILAYQQELAVNPDHAATHSDLAATLAQNGRPEESVVHYQKAIEKLPLSIRTRSNFAATLAQLGRYDESIAQSQEALRIDPKFMPARVNLGRALYNAGMPDEAVKSLKAAAAIEPKSLASFVYLGEELVKKGRRDLAARIFHDVLDVNPDHLGALAGLDSLEGSK